jgi:hypothetical protein
MAETRRTPLPRRSLYVKHNKAYELLLATLIVFFAAVCVVVFGSTFKPSSGVWTDNVLIRMIVETNEFIRGR